MISGYVFYLGFIYSTIIVHKDVGICIFWIDLALSTCISWAKVALELISQLKLKSSGLDIPWNHMKADLLSRPTLLGLFRILVTGVSDSTQDPTAMDVLLDAVTRVSTKPHGEDYICDGRSH